MKSLEKLITNEKIFRSGYFTQDFFDEELNNGNQFLIKYFDGNEKSTKQFKGALAHWSRSIEYPYIYFNIAKYLIETKKNYRDKNFQIFDNACGHAASSCFLASYGMNILGTDLVDLSNEWEEANAFANGSMKFKVADSLNLPFKNENFEISFCISAIEQISDPVKAIEEMIRVTKRGGLLLFTMDVTHYKNNLSDFYVNNENFKIIQSRLHDSCSFFAPPTFSVPSNILNWEINADKRTFLRKFVSDIYRKLINKKFPNLYIFGSSWIKK